MISVAAILAGGKGTRLLPRSGKLPKCLMEFGDKPFILHQIDWLIDQGISKIFVCTGHKHELIESFLSDQHYLKNLVTCSREPHALGTAGAIKYLIETKQLNGSILIVNGDTFFNFRLDQKLMMDKLNSYQALIWVSKIQEIGRFAQITVEGDKVTKYKEKEECDGEHSSCGCYVLDCRQVSAVVDRISSLEEDFLPGLVRNQKLGCIKIGANGFYDFGTVESFDQLLLSSNNWISE